MATKAAVGKLLLVDDSLINRRLGLSVLGRMGYAVDAVSSAEQAVDAVRNGNYAAVLMDIWMPGTDGFGATAAIRKLPPPKGELPIIAMTAHVAESDRRRCLDAGMDAHLGKPIDRSDLQAILNRLVGSPEGEAATPAVVNGEVAPAEKTIDDRVLVQLKKDAGAALIKELIAAYMAETDERLGRIVAALETDNLAEVGAEAHSLKSSSGTFGAPSLQKHAEQLELAASNGDHEAVAVACGVLPEIVDRTWQEFAARGYRRE